MGKNLWWIEIDGEITDHLVIHRQEELDYVFDNFTHFKNARKISMYGVNYISINIEKFEKLESLIINYEFSVSPLLGLRDESNNSIDGKFPKLPKSIKEINFTERSGQRSQGVDDNALGDFDWAVEECTQNMLEELSKLPNLIILKLATNIMGPHGTYSRRFNAMAKLTQIKKLYLKGLIPLFPDEFYLGVDLEYIEFEETSPLIITSLLSEIGTLKEFHLNNIYFIDLARYIQEIGFSVGCEVADVIPEWIGNLNNLKTLSLEWLEMEKYPEWLFKMQSLENLILCGNKITYLDERLFTEMNLNFLNLGGNIISNPNILYKRSLPHISIIQYGLSRKKRMSIDILSLPLEEMSSIIADFDDLDYSSEDQDSKSRRIEMLLEQNCRNNADEIRRLLAEIKSSSDKKR